MPPLSNLFQPFRRQPPPLERLVDSLTTIGRTLGGIQNQLERIGNHMANIDTATADLAGLTTVGDSLVSLLTAIRKEVKDLKSAGTDSATAAKIDALDATIKAKTAEWAAATVENTEAGGEPAPAIPSEP